MMNIRATSQTFCLAVPPSEVSGPSGLCPSLRMDEQRFVVCAAGGAVAVVASCFAPAQDLFLCYPQPPTVNVQRCVWSWGAVSAPEHWHSFDRRLAADNAGRGGTVSVGHAWNPCTFTVVLHAADLDGPVAIFGEIDDLASMAAF